MIRRLLPLLLVPLLALATDLPTDGEDVVLLHGLGRTERSMERLAEHLSHEGYTVHNLGYESTDHPPEELLVDLDARLRECCADATRLHFVGHSLGGLLARAWIAEVRPENLGRLVMLAPPNQGSRLADIFGDQWLGDAIMGPALDALGTDGDSLPLSLPPPDYDVGIIAGTGSINPIGTLMIPGEDDGIISICTTRLEGAADFLIVPSSHAFIMRSAQVARQTTAFLRDGRFMQAAPDELPECPLPGGEATDVTEPDG